MSYNKQRIIKKIVSYIKNRKEIICVYIFGSFLSSNDFSDIDLGLLLRKDSDDVLFYEIALENQLEDLIGFPFDVRVLNNAPIPFIYNVLSKGKVVIDNEPNLRADFESRIFRMYFDFDYFRKRYLLDIGNA